MIVKFEEELAGGNILEIEKIGDEISFYIYPYGNYEIGHSINLKMEVVQKMIKLLQGFNIYQ